MTRAALTFITMLLVAGCGGATQTVTVKTVTVTSSSASSTSASNPTQPARVNPHHGRDYPKVFETSFMNSCEQGGGTTQCTCALSYIEAHYTYPETEADLATNLVQSPEVQGAISQCANR